MNAIVRQQGVVIDGMVKKPLYLLPFGCMGHNYNGFNKKAEVIIC